MMNLFMTDKTKWYNTKPIFACVTFVMILLGLLATTALKLSGLRKVCPFYCLVYGTSCSNFSGIVFSILSAASSACQFELLGFIMFLVSLSERLLAMFSSAIFLVVQRCAFFAPILIAIFTKRMFIKFRSGFSYLAFGTSFVYDLLSHNQLLISWLRLEPVADYISASGSHYCMRDTGGCQC